MNLLKAVLIGAGQRGTDSVGGFARNNPDAVKFVAVAEPDGERRQRFAEQHGISGEGQFESADALFSSGNLADLCFITTLDRDHHGQALSALEAGYHVYLEKPMAETPEQILSIRRAALKSDRILQVCHPLRYTPFYRMVKNLLDDGCVGRILTLSMCENVAYWHFAHSFVRGNWRRTDETGPTILTKCCHDMDIATWLVGEEVASVSSHAGRINFHEGNAPEGAPARCLDGCPVEETCPYHAGSYYLGGKVDWPVSVISNDTSFAARRKALEVGPYGRCVYKCDNDVADHQVVEARFAGGALLDFSMRAQTTDAFRTIRISGTSGELTGHFEKNEIEVRRFGPGLGVNASWKKYRPSTLEGAHGGGDTGVIRNFLRLVHENAREEMVQSLAIAVEGHLLSFAAEAAREESCVIGMGSFKESKGV
ncbi:MAG: Gfo/Idh/MocA family oxidoreductase [Candidatus Sumerlaeia bacterium]|nr:Gfo/Idh/MocA family oxidoreductase [Candidatus Sumerlaeia bacterium]